MELKHAKKIHLNRYTHTVRASQAVLQYGVGAMVDFPNQTLMTAAPEYWKEQVTQIHDERLEKVLKVDCLGLPLGQDDPHCRDGISYVRFPEWYFCPKCRRFQPISEWIKDYRKNASTHRLDSDPEMLKKVQCPTCYQDLVVTRVVSACECGHIDDFPWVKWVHVQNMYGGPKHVCQNPKLTFKTSASSTEGLEGLTVTCDSCGARATLKGAFDTGKFEEIDKKTNNEYNFRCTGRHPWKNSTDDCGKYPKVLQRGSSSVYFPITASSLVIPPYSSLITKKIEESASFQKCKETIAALKHLSTMTEAVIGSMIPDFITQYSRDISLEIGVAESQVKPILERKWTPAKNEEAYTTASVKYRAEEYEALSGEVSLMNEGDFVREITNIDEYKIPGIKSISLIHKIREVQALLGFSRLSPIEQSSMNEESEYAVSIKQPDTDWYPAYQVRGEGIFIELDNRMIDEWLNNNDGVRRRVEHLNDSYKKSYTGSNRSRNITAKFILVHTISHLLMKQLSFECGYSIASIKERLYCSSSEEGKEMAGILIYTASGDSEGTLGGLVRQGRSDVFPGIYKKAIESAMTCSNDPVCSLSMGQGREMLSLSACYSCCLVPETSCEEFNILLDRGVVVGTYENREMGFYSPQLYEGDSWIMTTDTVVKHVEEYEDNKRFIVIDNGIDVTEFSFDEIWKSLLEWASGEREISNIKELLRSDAFSSIGKPTQDCIFQVSGSSEQYKCDLYWAKKKIAVFTNENVDSYKMARETDARCFFLDDESFSIEQFIHELM